MAAAAAFAHPVGQALAALVAGLLLTAALPLDAGLAQRYDAWLRIAAPLPPADAAVVVDVDEASVRRFGGWPLPRTAYLPVADWLLAQGARAIAFDMLFTDPRAGDDRFGDWLASAPAPVLLAARSLPAEGDGVPAQPTPPGCRAQPVAGWQLPLWARVPVTGAAALPIQQVGVMSVPVDADGLLRHWPLWQQAGPLALPVLPLAVWRAVNPAGAGGVSCAAWRQPDGTLAHATADSVQPLLAQADRAAPPLPLWRLADAAAGRLPAQRALALAAQVRGRVVFIGSSAALGDAVLTPQGLQSGLAVMAAAYDALAHGRLLAPPRPGLDAALLAVLLVPLVPQLVAWRRGAPRPWRDLAWLGLATALLLGVDAVLLAGLWQSTRIGLPVAALVSWGALVLVQWRLRALAEHRASTLARVSAEAANQAKGDFLAHVGHELRTPLNALLGAADLLAGTPLSPEQSRHVALFRSAGSELMRMLNDLLDLSRIEAGLLDVEHAPFSLSRLLAQQVMLFEARAAQQGVTLAVEPDADLPDAVLGDRHHLAQVLRNLLGNALKFTRQGSVTLVVHRPPPAVAGTPRDRIRFVVRDTGIGIPAHRLEAIFAPFTQADAATGRRYGGTGLGLAITRRLVRAMGGEVSVHSVDGQGSNFTVELPLPRSRQLPPHEPDPLDLAPADLAPSSQQPLRVLLADDRRLNVLLALAYLEGGGHTVEVAPDGAAAVRRFAAAAHDVVLLDMQMPVMDGLDAARAMRRIEQEQQRPRALLVAVTARTAPADVAEALAAGCDLHLAKPYSRSQLLAVLSRNPLAHPAHADRRSSALPSSPRQQAISRLPDSDLDEALYRIGSPMLYERVLDAAADSVAQFERRLDDALAADPADRVRAHRLVHDLKSLAGTLGLPGLADDARRLEGLLAGLAADPQAAPAAAEVATARAAVRRRLGGLQDALARAAQDGPRPPL